MAAPLSLATTGGGVGGGGGLSTSEKELQGMENKVVDLEAALVRSEVCFFFCP